MAARADRLNRIVVVDARMLAYPLTGIGRYVFELLTRLVRRPHTTWVVLSARPVPADLRAQFVGTVEWVEGSVAQRAELWTQRTARRELQRRPAAMFLGLANSVPFFGPRGRNYALVVYDLSCFIVPLLNEPADLVKAFTVTLPALRRADRLIAISPQVEVELHRIVRRSRGRTVALPPGGTRFSGTHSLPFEQRRGFLAVGAHRRKNTGLLLDAYALLPTAVRKDHPLFIVARRLPQRIERGVGLLGLAEDVRLIPDARDLELADLYSRCRVLVYPSAYEGLGLPVAEAMLAGVPSIVPAGSPMAAFLDGAGVAVRPLEPRVLADAMESLATKRDVWEQAARAAERGAAQFDWDRVADAAARALGL